MATILLWWSAFQTSSSTAGGDTFFAQVFWVTLVVIAVVALLAWIVAEKWTER